MTAKPRAVKEPEGNRDFPLDRFKLRRLRMEAALSVTELARRCGCTPAHITMLEKGRHGPSMDFVATATAVLGCTPRDLMHDEADAKPAPAADGSANSREAA